ncbi:MAG: polysaccharide deacetylase family protein, partial [Planctomycetaceae bacterium]|nr:polysaccharide deacetylase family protein [Planctomycetaceae bacterium]
MKSGVAFRSLAKRVARGVLGTLFQRHPRHPRVLMYHSVDDSGSVLSVTRDQLRWHLQILCELGFRGLSIAEFCSRAVAAKLAGTEPEVLLTFDDGYQNFSDCAVPLLSEFGFPATVFIVPAFMGGLPQWYERDSHIAAELAGQLASEPAEVADHLGRINELASMPLMTWAEAAAVA